MTRLSIYYAERQAVISDDGSTEYIFEKIGHAYKLDSSLPKVRPSLPVLVFGTI